MHVKVGLQSQRERMSGWSEGGESGLETRKRILRARLLFWLLLLMGRAAAEVKRYL